MVKKIRHAGKSITLFPKIVVPLSANEKQEGLMEARLFLFPTKFNSLIIQRYENKQDKTEIREARADDGGACKDDDQGDGDAAARVDGGVASGKLCARNLQGWRLAVRNP